VKLEHAVCGLDVSQSSLSSRMITLVQFGVGLFTPRNTTCGAEFLIFLIVAIPLKVAVKKKQKVGN
jgi:hypothetical protein